MKLPRKVNVPLYHEDVFDEFDKESDRAAAILGAAYLDAAMEAAIRTWLRPDEAALDQFFDPRQHGFLSTFSAKKNMAYALGLLEDWMLPSVQAVASVRNFFAHHLLEASSFAHPAVVAELDRVYPSSKYGPRERFLHLVQANANHLGWQELRRGTNADFQGDYSERRKKRGSVPEPEPEGT